MEVICEGVRLEKDTNLYNYLLGIHFYDEKRIKKNPKLALEYFKKAADQGHPISQFNVGIIYQYRQDIVEKDLKQAVMYYKLAAAQNYILAIHNLGFCYMNGFGIEENELLAVEMYKTCADKGYFRSQYNLGKYYKNKNDELSFKYLELSAQQGYVLAQNECGIYYEFGIGVIKDLNKAISYYKMAVTNNFRENKNQRIAKDNDNTIGLYCAYSNLARCHYFGIGMDVHYGEAFKYYELAANNGCVETQYILGILYYDGINCDKNEIKGIEYLKLASNNGYENARKFLLLIGFE